MKRLAFCSLFIATLMTAFASAKARSDESSRGSRGYTDEFGDDFDYQGRSPYERCLREMEKRAKHGGYDYTDLRDAYNQASADYVRCEKRVQDYEFSLGADRDQINRASWFIRFLLVPAPQSGFKVEKFELNLGVGTKSGVLHTTTKEEGSLELKIPRLSVLFLDEDYAVKVVGKIERDTQGVQAAHGRLELKTGATADVQRGLQMKDGIQRNLHGDSYDEYDDAYRSQREKDKHSWIDDLTSASLQKVIRLEFDRDLTLKRPWDFSVALGYDAALEKKSQSAAATATIDVGGYRSENRDRPYIRVVVDGQAMACSPISKSRRHLLCVDAEIALKPGFPRTGVQAHLRGEYRYVFSDDEKHYLGVGPEVEGSADVDPDGGHTAGGAYFTVKAQ